MEKKRALKILIANTYCNNSNFDCLECPLFYECKSNNKFTENDLHEALKTLKE